MLKKLFFLLFFPIYLFGFELPTEFFVTEKWFSLTRGFDIETTQYRVGTVYRNLWSFQTAYDFFDPHENLLATARMRWLTFGAVFDVLEMPLERPIGRVEEEIFTWYPKFTIFSPFEEKLAIAQMNFWGTTYEVTDPLTNEVMATLTRSFFRLKDDWKATLEKPELFMSKQIDPRLFITVMAFQTDCDHWKSQQDDNVIIFEAKRNSFGKGEADHSKRLATYHFLAGVKPTDHDFERVMKILDEELEKNVPPHNGSREFKLEKALNIAFKLFEREELTVAEKSALYHLIEKKILSDK